MANCPPGTSSWDPRSLSPNPQNDKPHPPAAVASRKVTGVPILRNENMKERPIIFSAPMVRAILCGQKTQTRRIMKPQPDEDGKVMVGQIGTSCGVAYVGNQRAGGLVTRVPCPYGQPSDRLWVREPWVALDKNYHPVATLWYLNKMLGRGESFIPAYQADHQDPKGDGPAHPMPWRSSMFMPRWASRLTLEITEIRVQRVQEIDAEDCIAEGLKSRLREHDAVCDLRDQYQALWDSLNAKKTPWESNPWVWAITFRLLLKEE